MDWYIEQLITHGYWGMFVSAFIAGSIFPFSSEAVMVALIALRLDPFLLAIYATIGNWLGTMLNYYVGTFGKIEWIEKYLRIKHERVKQAERFMQGRGAIMGIFTFLPVIGSAISVVLGLMRANLLMSTISIFVGKAIRYVALIYFTRLWI